MTLDQSSIDQSPIAGRVGSSYGCGGWQLWAFSANTSINASEATTRRQRERSAVRGEADLSQTYLHCLRHFPEVAPVAFGGCSRFQSGL